MTLRSTRLAPLATTLAIAFTACGTMPASVAPVDAPAPPPPPPVDPDASVEIRPRNVDAVLVERSPLEFATVALPAGAAPAFPWVDREGTGFVVTSDARFFRVNAYGHATAVERLQYDAPGPMESPPGAVVEVNANEPFALVPDGALTVREGTFRRAALPALLANGRAMARWGAESLWATSAGLYTTQGARWLRLDREGAPVVDVTALVPGVSTAAVREAWVLRANGALARLRVAPGAGDAVTVVWSDPVPGMSVGAVRAIARFGADRYVAREQDLLRVDATNAPVRVRVPGMSAGPAALAPSGPWLWMAWEGAEASALGRFDGATVEVLARGTRAASPRLSVDPTHGDVALLVDGGRVRRVVADAHPVVTGFVDGTITTEARLPLQVEPPVPSAVASVTFSLDGARLEVVTAPPYRWGVGGADLYRALPTLTFGEHAVEAVIAYRGADPLTVRRAFRYLSPLGRVPTFRADIAPLYASACARCHSTAIARDLRGYMRMADMAPIVSSAVQSRRMPPDLSLDASSIQLVTAWVAGGAPE